MLTSSGGVTNRLLSSARLLLERVVVSRDQSHHVVNVRLRSA